jgi:hypothetical protein
LRRQDKAAKLDGCLCSHEEMVGDFRCADIKRNMEELCREEEEDVTDVTSDAGDVAVTTTSPGDADDVINEIDVDQVPAKSEAALQRFPRPVILLMLMQMRL